MARIPLSAIASAVLLCAPGTAWAQNASYPCGYVHGPGMMGWGGGWSGMFFGPFFMILGLAGLVAVTFLLVRSIGSSRHGGVSNHTPPQTPLEILKERYARGEIDKEEYDERRRVLSE